MSQCIMLVFRFVLKDFVYWTVTQEKSWRIFVQRLFYMTAERMHAVESENTGTNEALPVWWVNSR